MHIQIVNFNLKDMSHAEFGRACDEQFARIQQHLRPNLEDLALRPGDLREDAPLIETVWGVGYRFKQG